MAKIKVTTLLPFVGRVSDASPHAIPPGAAQLQKNMQIVRSGILQGRGGNRPVTFAATTTATSHDVIAVHRFDRPEATWAVYLTSGGNLKAGRGVT